MSWDLGNSQGQSVYDMDGIPYEMTQLVRETQGSHRGEDRTLEGLTVMH